MLRAAVFTPALILMGIVLSAAEQSPSPYTSASHVLTAEELFRPVPVATAAISPTGQRLAAIVTDGADRQHLMVIDLETGRRTGVQAQDRLDVSAFRWISDERLVFNVTSDKRYAVGLYTASAVHPEGIHALNRFDATRIVGVPISRPGRVLVYIAQSAEDLRPGPMLELDVNDRTAAYSARGDRGAVRTYALPKAGSVLELGTTQQGELRLCTTQTGAGKRLHCYQPEKNSWENVGLDLEATTPVGLDPDDRYLWVTTWNEQTGSELRRYNLDTREFSPAVHTDKDYDMGEGSLWFRCDTGELAGIRYMQRKPTAIWFASEYLAAQKAIDAAFPHSDNLLIDRDRTERKFLFLITGAQQPGTFVLLDVEAKKLSPIGGVASWLQNRPLQPTNPISFRARDGVRLEGYLTLPPSAGEDHPAPLVVLPHGGPQQRDTPSFHPEVQFLVSRGYAVLQPNYRGSTGYTKPISIDPRFDYRRMHEDVTDATRAVLSSGMVDPKRVAIMGTSFGGHLALCGVAFEEGLYACAVSANGVFDWEKKIEIERGIGRTEDYEFMVQKLGRPGADRERFAAITPSTHVDRIRVPILISDGADERILDVAGAHKLAAALKRRGVPHETFFRELNGRDFDNYKDRVEYYHRVEAFLAAHLGGASLVPVKAPRRQR